MNSVGVKALILSAKKKPAVAKVEVVIKSRLFINFILAIYEVKKKVKTEK
jgi:hypothetical protein